MNGRGNLNPSMAPPVGKSASYVSSSQFIRRESIMHEEDIFSKYMMLGRGCARDAEPAQGSPKPLREAVD